MKEQKTAPRHESAGPSSACNHRMAIPDINRAQELLRQLHAVLLQLHPSNAEDMLEEIRKFNSSALSRLQSCVCGSSDASEDSQRDIYGNDKMKRLKRSWSKQETWSIATTFPYDDGHRWRKYGHKIIKNAKYPKHYYRCVFRDKQGCLAKKTVQQEDSHGDPPRFNVEYRAPHTCKTINVVFPSVMESAPMEASGHASGSSCSLKLQENHISPLAHAAIEAQDEGLWISELLGSDMVATEPWDLDMFLEDDDGWYNVP
ncbi:WRKY transcription factor [Musa troglodytarum]|uniref:WRKY transcription factor n=1 Tax=Musa troglodytarum TaxID=320322 RepID=A0A9E7JZA0_9LILI|nr:WRKY transcription factor [Musa troglodytarum]